jgi:hypothetical protein
MLYVYFPLPPFRTCAAKGHKRRIQFPHSLYFSPSSTASFSLSVLVLHLFFKKKRKHAAAQRPYHLMLPPPLPACLSLQVLVVPPRHDSLPSSLSLSPPHFDCCRAACKLQHCSRASVDIADANPQYIATASVIGLQLLQVTAPAPAAFPACASRRLLRRWMPAHRGRWSPAARSGSRCTPSPPFRRVHPKSPSRTVVNVCCAAGGVGAHAHEQRQQHSRSCGGSVGTHTGVRAQNKLNTR